MIGIPWSTNRCGAFVEKRHGVDAGTLPVVFVPQWARRRSHEPGASHRRPPRRPRPQSARARSHGGGSNSAGRMGHRTRLVPGVSNADLQRGKRVFRPPFEGRVIVVTTDRPRAASRRWRFALPEHSRQRACTVSTPKPATYFLLLCPTTAPERARVPMPSTRVAAQRACGGALAHTRLAEIRALPAAGRRLSLRGSPSLRTLSRHPTFPKCPGIREQANADWRLSGRCFPRAWPKRTPRPS